MSKQPLRCPISLDSSLGPWAGYECRGGFDFTLRFEENVLNIPLQCAFIIAVLMRFAYLAREQTKVKNGVLFWAKATFSIVLVALNIALLALWATTSNNYITHTPATIPAAALTFVASFGLCLLSWMEHRRAFKPSAIIVLYLVLALLLELPRARTLWLMGSYRPIPGIFVASIVVRAVMLILESFEKRSLVLAIYKDCSHDTTRGLLNEITFAWLGPLFRTGFKRILFLEDVDEFEETMRTETLHRALAEAWEQVPDKTRPNILCYTCIRVYAGPILAAVVPKLFIIALTYAQPFLISDAVAVASTPEVQVYNNWAYGLIGAFALVYILMGVAYGQYAWRTARTISMVKGGVSALLYEQALGLDVVTPDISSAGILTLSGTDIDTLASFVASIHDLWGCAAEIAIADWLLYRQLGAACAIPICCGLVLIIASMFLALPIGISQAAWIQASQDRVTATSKLIRSIKCLKISGLSDLAFDIIHNLRVRELKISTRYRYLLGTSMVTYIFAPIWIPILTFSLYAGLAEREDDGLSLQIIFTAYSLLILLNGPLQSVVSAFPSITGGMTSFGRIQTYLNGKKRIDNRTHALLEKQQHNRHVRDTSLLDVDIRQPKLGDECGVDPAENLSEKTSEASTVQASGSDSPTDIIASVQGEFSWEGSEEPVIKIEDWSIQRRHLNFVLGAVGCGKSTLLKALLGELPDFKGKIWTAFSGVAYCAQSPWIPNDTVRNIIVGRGTCDSAWYAQVVHACALTEDIRNWPQGDESLAGSKGISLSGGQRHRLAIARAVYARKEFTILDDVFSGLDPATETRVFDNLFSTDGLLRRGDQTVVLAVSSDRRVVYADRVLVLDAKGTVRSAGTPAELKNIISSSHKEVQSSEMSSEEPNESAVREIIPVEDSDEVLAKKDPSRRTGDTAMYGYFLTGVGWVNAIIFAVTMAVYAFCGAFPSVWIGWWAAASNPLGDIGKWLGVYVVLGFGSFVGSAIAIWTLCIPIINKSGMFFHESLLKTTSLASMSYHTSVDSGITLNRFSQELQLVDMDLPVALLGASTTFAFTIAQFIVVAASAKYMAALLPLIMFFMYVLQSFYLRTSRQMRLLDIEQRAPVFTHLSETLEGLMTIRAMGWEDRWQSHHMIVLDESRRPGFILNSIQAWLNYALDMILAIMAVIFIVITTTLRDQIGARSMGTGLSGLLAYSNVSQQFVNHWAQLEIALGAIARIKTFVTKTKPAAEYEGEPIDTDTKNWPSRGAVELKGVTASYPSSGKCLDDVTVSIEAGQKVAICGRTGSGKSSLTLCLLRLMSLDQGLIMIDGLDIARLSYNVVRSGLVALPQDTYIFDDTVRMNVDPSKQASDDEIVTVLSRVQLWDKVVARGGLDAEMYDGFFSHGETQLLVFARAMIRKSKLLILDEFTSSLDNETTKIIDEVLMTWFKDWTVISVVHKLKSAVDFDMVVVIDGGMVVETGQPRELLGTDSLFKSLHDQA